MLINETKVLLNEGRGFNKYFLHKTYFFKYFSLNPDKENNDSWCHDEHPYCFVGFFFK